MKRIFLTGGWGYGNIGDNAILKATLESINKHLSTNILITSFSVKEVKFHNNIDSIESIHKILLRKNLTSFMHFLSFSIWYIIFKITGKNFLMLLTFKVKKLVLEMQNSDILVMAGGGYFNDKWKSSFFARSIEIMIAKILNKKVMIYGQTVGPFSSLLSRMLFKKIINKVDFICYRDEQSLNILKFYDYNLNNTCLTADEANLIPLTSSNKNKHDHLLVGVMIQNFRPYESSNGTLELSDVKNSDQFLDIIVKSLERIYLDKNVEFIFLPSTIWDIDANLKIKSKLESKIQKECKIILNQNVTTYIDEVRTVDLLISTNMHPIIFATANNVPVLGISYFYKVDDFMNSVGLNDYVIRIDQITIDKLLELSYKMINNSIEIKSVIKQNLPFVKEKAKNNIYYLKKILEE